jgi:hypothetical protein
MDVAMQANPDLVRRIPAEGVAQEDRIGTLAVFGRRLEVVK